MNKKFIVGYPGRFQPFSPHHNETYKFLVKKFGKDNVFILTSNKTDRERSPLSFREKKAIIKKYGIKNVIETKSPYSPVELITGNEDKVLIMCYGEKDAGRLAYKKKDGSQGYFQKFEKNIDYELARDRAYVIVAPHVSMTIPGIGEMSGTNIRKFIRDNVSEKEFKKVMGWFDVKLYTLLKTKFAENYQNLIADQKSINENNDNKYLVKCEVCGKMMKQIQYRHLKYSHNITMKEYREKYPNAILIHEERKNTGDKNPAKTLESRKKISENNPMCNPEYVRRNKDSWKRNGGVEKLRKKMIEDNPSKRPEVRKILSQKIKEMWDSGRKTYNYDKTRDTQEKSGRWIPIHKYTNKENYYRKVKRITENSFRKYFYHIKNAKKRGNEWSLDHMYSINQGFLNNIPPEIIGHYCNLHMLPRTLNESKGQKNSLLIEELIYRIEYSLEPVSNKILLQCGGGAGHMLHIMEDLDLTFKDLEKIIDLGLKGKLNIENEVSEKTDGMNLLITFKDGEVKASRNKSTIINPMSADELIDKYADRGDVGDAFKFAIQDLTKAFRSMKKADEIFQNGKVFANIEIIYSKNEMTLSYGDDNFLQFHNLIEFDEKANVVSTNNDVGRDLYNIFKMVDEDVQEHFKIIPPNILQIEQDKNYESKLKQYKSQLQKLQKEFKLSSSSTIFDYYNEFWKKYINDNFKIDDKTIIDGLIKRWTGVDNSFRINGKTIEDKDLLNKIKEFQPEAIEIQKSNIEKFKSIIFNVSTDVLNNVTNFLAANPDKQIRRLRNNLAKSVIDIRNSGDEKKLALLKKNFDILNSIGGSKKIVPAEGLVFQYKGKLFKMTGSFAAVHQIISALKFDR